MSEQSQGDRWWLASDGRWYPPEVHPETIREQQAGWVAPDGPTTPPQPNWIPTSSQEHGNKPLQEWPPAPSPPKKPKRSRLFAIGVFLVVAVVALAVFATLGTQADHGHSTADSSAAPATGQVITARGGSISLTMPAGWRGADLSTGVQAAAAALFPDDPNAAANIEPRLNVLPRAVVVFGVRASSTASSSTFADNVNVLSDPTAPASLTLEEIGPAEAHGIAQFATVTSQDVVDLGARQAYRITYKTSAFSGVAYIIKGTADTWVLTYTFGTATPDVDLAQSSASSFNAP